MTDGSAPADGIYDLRFALYSADAGGSPLTAPLINGAVPVNDGLFAVTLDFGQNFPGADRWVEIAVRTNGAGAFSPLNPRHKITAAPYAITARNVTGVVPGAGLSGTYGSAVTFNNTGNSFSGSGAGLTGVNAATLGGQNANQFWRITGNSGTTSASFLGTTDNQPLELRVNGQRALRFQPGANAMPSIIAGSRSYSIAAFASGATIAGGDRNFIESFDSAASDFAAICGGSSNRIGYSSFNSVIGGGFQNTLEPNAYYSTLAGGLQNRMGFLAFNSTISGGRSNVIDHSVDTSTIGGGGDNYIGSLAHYAVVGAGRNNLVLSNAEYAVISGGRENTIGPSGVYSTVGGGERNRILSGRHGTIAGGGANRIDAFSGTIGGGTGNSIGTNAYESVISGGVANLIQTNANRSAIVGGAFHEIRMDAQSAFIGGGVRNHIGTNSGHATIAGGSNNSIGDDSPYAFIGGGTLHTISPQSAHATIAGGDGNVAGGEAPGIGGGTLNILEPDTVYGLIAGGGGNRVGGGSFASTIAGGFQNQTAGHFTFAAGKRASALHNGAFVWADDSVGAAFSSTSSNQFLIRAAGGVGIGTGSPLAPLHVVGNNSQLRLHDSVRNNFWNIYTEQLANPGTSGNLLFFPGPGGVFGFIRKSDGNYFSGSDARLKKDVARLEGVLERVLKLRPVSYRFKSAPEAAPRVLGLIAQEVEPLFPEVVSQSAGMKALAYSELVPVTVSAIQELNQKLERTLQQKDDEIAELKQSMAELKEMVNKLAATAEWR